LGKRRPWKAPWKAIVRQDIGFEMRSRHFWIQERPHGFAAVRQHREDEQKTGPVHRSSTLLVVIETSRRQH
ncbi:MAG: hypothetical protein QGG36_08945, partial [Pirellulaceae bacterium]|nr:hypothetical protein [Pirellulaceae bacterium]